MKRSVRILCMLLVAITLVATLASCGAPSEDPDAVDAALEEKGYVVSKLKNKMAMVSLAAVGINTAECLLSAIRIDGSNVDQVTVVYFKTADDAKEAMEKIGEYAEPPADTKDSNWVAPTRSGKLIYFGTKQGVKDAK